jgi:MHS family proline/betaine transporter-like MFS transporter
MQSKRILFASVIGNWVEWYNFLLFIYLEPVMAKLFFPTVNRFVAVTLVFVLFAAGFLARPFGSVLFGFIGDRYGRQRALVWSMGALAAAACLMTVMPTYQVLGIVSPILVTLCRVGQGLSAGGEHIGSAVYLLESAPANRKALWVSLAPTTATLGLLSGSFAAFLLTAYMPMDKILAWGWRVPFAVGAVISLGSIKLRLSLPETPVFQRLQAQSKLNLKLFKQLFSNFREFKKLLLIVSLTACWAVFYNTLYVWLPSYLSHYMQLDHLTALRINSFCMLLLTVLIVSGGYLADKIKPLSLLLLSTAALLLLTYPLFKLIATGNLFYIYLAVVAFTIFISLYLASSLIIMLQIFSAEIRYTAASLSFNFSLAVFGGTVPLVAGVLVHVMHNVLAPAYYLMVVALLAFIVGYRFKALYV